MCSNVAAQLWRSLLVSFSSTLKLFGKLFSRFQMAPLHSLMSTSSQQFKFVIASGGFLIDVCCIWPFIFCAFSFGLFFAIHPNSRDKVDGHRQIPTLSQTGKLVPESLFFTFGLHSEAMLLAFLFTFVYVHFKNKINAIFQSLQQQKQQQQPLLEDGQWNSGEEDSSMVLSVLRRTSETTHCEGLNFFCCCLCKPQASRETDVKFLEFWNRTLIVLGLIAALLMALVGTVTLDVNTTVHGAIAFFMYLAAILHMLFFYFTIAKTMGYSAFQINLVRLCLFVCLPFNIIMMVAIGLMYSNCDTDEICQQAAIDLIPTLEYTTTIALLGYVYSFREDLKDINLLTMAAVASLPPVVTGTASECETACGFGSDGCDYMRAQENTTNAVYTPPVDDNTFFTAAFNQLNAQV